MENVIYMCESKIANLIKDNQELFNHLVASESLEREEAIAILKTVVEERPSYLKAVDNISVLREIEVSIFEKYCGKLSELTEGEIHTHLHNLGFDIKTSPYYVFTRVKKVAGTIGIDVKRVILGQERLDKEWINKRDSDGSLFSSYEAREHLKNLKDPTRRSHFGNLFH